MSFGALWNEGLGQSLDCRVNVEFRKLQIGVGFELEVLRTLWCVLNYCCQQVRFENVVALRS